MKKINLILFILGLFVITACDDDSTGNVSRITTYPTITLNGDAVMLVKQGSTFSDPGVVALEGETQLDATTTYTKGVYSGAAGVDTNKPDLYIATYSADNSDGFTGTASRYIWVANTGDLTTSIEGLYKSSVQRAPTFTPEAKYTDMMYVVIWKTGANTYELSHAVGGYYDFGRGYGSKYAARGAVITANNIAANDFAISQAQFPAWGNTVEITDFTVDANAKTITFTGTGNFGNGAFKVQLTQVQF